MVHSFQHHTNIVHSEQSKSAACVVWVDVYLLQTQFAVRSQNFKQCLSSCMSNCVSKLPGSNGLWHSSEKRKEKKGKEKTAPFGINLMRSQVLYRAAQVPGSDKLNSNCVMSAK